MGIALKDQGKLQDAIKLSKKRSQLRLYPEAYNNMGNALKDQGKLEEAIEAYNRAVSIKPNYAEAYTNTTELLKMYSRQVRNHIFYLKITAE